MKVRNCLSLAKGTKVSGKELCEFFYHATKYVKPTDMRKWDMICWYLYKAETNGWLQEDAMYEVDYVTNYDTNKDRERIWFRKIQEV